MLPWTGCSVFATVSVKDSLIHTGSIKYLKVCIVIVIIIIIVVVVVNRGGFALTSEHARHSLSGDFGEYPRPQSPDG